MATLELENVSKRYSDKAIPIKDMSFTVADGEFLSLLGPSGCGKSTLLRLIAGLESPTQGRIIIGGKSVNQLSPGDRNVAMVFQSYALYPHMTAADNIATSLKLRRLPADVISQRVTQAAQKLKLIDGANNWLPYKPSQLSGGQRQRVALARALVRQPDVFLLDEPLSNLDALLREQVRAELKQIFQEQHKPVVYVTHDQTEAMTLSSKVAVLYEGYIQQLDAPHRLYSQPANQFVAGFVGTPQMNLLELSCENNRAILGAFPIPLPALGNSPKHIVLGIRPEDIRLVASDLTQLEGAYLVEGQVYLVEALGKENLVSVRVQGSDLTLRLLLANDQSGEGGRLKLALPHALLHWFSWQGSPQQPLYQRDRLPTLHTHSP
jgi:multiple sugar transport system ATP-binding protein